MTFTESGLPLWLSLNESTGEISGTPEAGDVGEYTDISITVSDGQAEATLGPFTITVQASEPGFGDVDLDRADAERRWHHAD